MINKDERRILYTPEEWAKWLGLNNDEIDFIKKRDCNLDIVFNVSPQQAISKNIVRSIMGLNK
jgi:hypothetical protein